jgi:hypothetical protein
MEFLFSHNRKGNPRYPAGTSVRFTTCGIILILNSRATNQHYRPSSLLFKAKHRKHCYCLYNNTLIFSSTSKGNSIIISNLSVICMLGILLRYALTRGWSSLAAHYLLPWLVRIRLSVRIRSDFRGSQCAHNWCVFSASD